MYNDNNDNDNNSNDNNNRYNDIYNNSFCEVFS